MKTTDGCLAAWKQKPPLKEDVWAPTYALVQDYEQFAKGTRFMDISPLMTFAGASSTFETRDVPQGKGWLFFSQGALTVLEEL